MWQVAQFEVEICQIKLFCTEDKKDALLISQYLSIAIAQNSHITLIP